MIFYVYIRMNQIYIIPSRNRLLIYILNIVKRHGSIGKELFERESVEIRNDNGLF